MTKNGTNFIENKKRSRIFYGQVRILRKKSKANHFSYIFSFNLKISQNIFSYFFFFFFNLRNVLNSKNFTNTKKKSKSHYFTS